MPCDNPRCRFCLRPRVPVLPSPVTPADIDEATKDARNGAWAIGAMADIAEHAELNRCVLCGLRDDHIAGCALFDAPSAAEMRKVAARLLAHGERMAGRR